MKILHLPESYLPWLTGGKEVYCHTLVAELQRLGVENSVVVHQNPLPNVAAGSHMHEGVRVQVLPWLPEFGSRRVSYEKTFPALPGFADFLAAERPDVVHFHDQGGGASLSHLREVKRQGIPAVITCHSPGQTCPQRELLRFGQIPCDGEIRLRRCTACRLTVSGVPRLASEVVSLAEWPGVDPWSGSRMARVLSGRQMTRLFRDSLREFVVLADAILVLAEWSREVWRRNGVPDHKLHLIRTGGRVKWAGEIEPKFPDRKLLKIACVGRCTRIKGIHVLVEAVQRLPNDAPIEVHFLGPYWNQEAYGRELLRRIAGDRRFLLPRLVPNADLLSVLAEMDVVVIPSIWLETGPLTLFDAFAAGVPVIGSRLGGLAELIEEGKNGLLFEAGNGEALHDHLVRLLAVPAELDHLRKQLKALRTMATVAQEHTQLYRKMSSKCGHRAREGLVR